MPEELSDAGQLARAGPLAPYAKRRAYRRDARYALAHSTTNAAGLALAEIWDSLAGRPSLRRSSIRQAMNGAGAAVLGPDVARGTGQVDRSPPACCAAGTPEGSPQGYLRAAAAYFLRNLSTRPAVSTIFCLPV